MVSARRRDTITNREFPLRREPFNSLSRQRRLRDGSINSRTIFIDQDEIPLRIAQALDGSSEISYDVRFAPAQNDESREPPAAIIPAGAESDDESATTTSEESECSTIEINLDNPASQLPLSILRAWENNAWIPSTTSRGIQTDHPDYPSPSYSPVQPGEYPLDWSPEPFSPIPEGSADEEINQILDYINSEEFLDDIINL